MEWPWHKFCWRRSRTEADFLDDQKKQHAQINQSNGNSFLNTLLILGVFGKLLSKTWRLTSDVLYQLASLNYCFTTVLTQIESFLKCTRHTPASPWNLFQILLSHIVIAITPLTPLSTTHSTLLEEMILWRYEKLHHQSEILLSYKDTMVPPKKLVRVVSIKTATGIYKRPVAKIAASSYLQNILSLI